MTEFEKNELVNRCYVCNVHVEMKTVMFHDQWTRELDSLDHLLWHCAACHERGTRWVPIPGRDLGISK